MFNKSVFLWRETKHNSDLYIRLHCTITGYFDNKDAEECFFFFSLLFGDKYLEYAKVDFKPALQLLRSCLILKTKQHMGNTDLYPLDK